MRLFIALVLLAAAGAGGFVCWLGLRDPLAALARATKPDCNGICRGTARRPDAAARGAGVARRRPIGLAISLPDPLAKRPLPIVMVLAPSTGESNIRHVAGSGDNAIVGYDWPIPTALPRGWDLVAKRPTFMAGPFACRSGRRGAGLARRPGAGRTPTAPAFSASHWARAGGAGRAAPCRAPAPHDRLDGARLWRLADR